MKLTEERLKKIIMEEVNALNELDPFGVSKPNPMAQTDREKESQAPKDKEPANLTSLGDQLIGVGRAVKASKIKGLDSNEIKLINSVLANVLEVASGKSAGTLLSRLNDLLNKQK